MKSIQDFTPEDALKELKHPGSIPYHLSTYTHTYIITFHTEDCLRTFSRQTVIKHEPNAEEAFNSIKKEFGNEVKVVIDFIYMEQKNMNQYIKHRTPDHCEKCGIEIINTYWLINPKNGHVTLCCKKCFSKLETRK